MNDCKTKDRCRLRETSPQQTTLGYYPPVYDGYGNNLNPDMNTTTSEYHCSGCDKRFIASNRDGKVEYTVITMI